ncbi:AraC family transcriptional regulator [Paenibacillus sp. NFR01]|uniref:helix-turn-helix transcriptional regulator n=1 Tax=Paenibacillus sp. NFR01 TaxID=1566279 RepID=UPI0008BCC462|nr:AraC family transcriptional regulator [Paenibacillus sp. NFR01]SET90666.1 AraC family transcriptional regulator, arabinose operon regulatory protein [Paenibacillus sp. NFR01]
MDLRLHACAYSFHTLPFKTSFTPPPYYLFRLQVTGSSKALVHGKIVRLDAGDLLIIRPGEPYHLSVEEIDGRISSGDYYLLCEGAWMDAWFAARHRPTLQRIHLDAGMLSLWQQLSVEQHRVVGAQPELIRHLLCALCLSLDRLSVEESSLEAPKRSNEMVMRMQLYISENALSPLRVEDVAAFAGLSVSRAVHLFKDLTGYTIIGYAQEIRLSNALERIRYTDFSLESIASSCGFGTYSYFHKVFKARFGFTPREIRSRHAEPDHDAASLRLKDLSGMSPDALRFLTLRGDRETTDEWME